MNDTPTELTGEGIWARLRRRKVVQWGVAYAAGAWGVLQGLQFFAETYEWSSQVLKLSTLVLLIGLPIVLVLAWYHGDRGEQRVKATEFAILTLLFMLGGGIFWYYQRAAETSTVASSSPTSAAPVATDASIAVLPFVNMSSDKEQEYFADGISEELLNLLTQVPGLRVIARTSSFSFKGKDVEIDEIAHRLNVANVLEGSVRKSGETVRITAQLVRASDSSHLWSRTYDRDLRDVFAVQDEIAAAVVDELKVELFADIRSTKPTNPSAYALFLQGREMWRQATPAAYEQAIMLYRQALAIDPRYVAAWVELARTYDAQADANLRLPDEVAPLAREAVNKALKIDPDFALAHSELGWITLLYDRDLATAAHHVQRALILEPVNPDILDVAGALARKLGRLDEAIAIGEFLAARDPVNVDAHAALSLAYRYSGRLDESIVEGQLALKLKPGYTWLHRLVGDGLLQKGDAKAALDEMQKMQKQIDEQPRLGGLSIAFHALGRDAESDTALAELIDKYEKTSAYWIACVFAYRGEADQAFEWLDRAVKYENTDLVGMQVQPLLANLHSDPRWVPFLRKLGMAPEQLAAIEFDVKVPR